MLTADAWVDVFTIAPPTVQPSSASHLMAESLYHPVPKHLQTKSLLYPVLPLRAEPVSS